MGLSTLFLSFRKALTAVAHVVHGEAERLVEEKVLDLSQVSRVLQWMWYIASLFSLFNRTLHWGWLSRSPSISLDIKSPWISVHDNHDFRFLRGTLLWPSPSGQQANLGWRTVVFCLQETEVLLISFAQHSRKAMHQLEAKLTVGSLALQKSLVR